MLANLWRESQERLLTPAGAMLASEWLHPENFTVVQVPITTMHYCFVESQVSLVEKECSHHKFHCGRNFLSSHNQPVDFLKSREFENSAYGVMYVHALESYGEIFSEFTAMPSPPKKKNFVCVCVYFHFLHDHILFTLDFRQEETDAAQEKHSSVGGHHYSPSLGQDYSRNRSRSHSPREKKSRSESSSRRRSHFNRSRSPHRKRSRSQSPRDRSGRSFRHKRDDSFGSRRADDPDVERRHSSHMQKSQQDCVEGQFGSEDSSYGQEHQHRSKKKSSKHKKHKHKKHKSKSYHSDSEDGH